MKYALLATILALASLALALDGQIGIHDPSTVVLCDGKYYTYGTGGTSLVSDDGWTWRRGAALPRADWPPTSFTSATAITYMSPRTSGRSPKPPST